MSGIPIPGSEKFEAMVDFMRQDLENDMGYSKLIEAARKKLEAEGKDFDEEFKKWEKIK